MCRYAGKAFLPYKIKNGRRHYDCLPFPINYTKHLKEQTSLQKARPKRIPQLFNPSIE